MSDVLRDHIAARLGCDGAVVDRLAAAFGLAAGRTADAPVTPHADTDGFPGGAALRPLLRLRGTADLDDTLGRAVAAGRQILADLVDAHPDDPNAAVCALFQHSAAAPTAAASGVDVAVGDRGGEVVRWAFDREGGSQTNANTRITGAPGAGKSRFLLHLLAAVAHRAPHTGFVLLDYKGDLGSDADFVRATRATVVRPEHGAIPINPFDLPEGLDRRLTASAIAETIASIGSQIGDVQKMLLRAGIARAYQAHPSPSSADLASAVAEEYASASRPPDSVTALLEQLAGYGLFATRSDMPLDAFLARRWIIDLSGLQALRDLVAFVLLGWLARHVGGMLDAPLHPGPRRGLRCVLAIDEAHAYLKHRNDAVLDLLRVGRSKGLPVVLSSQSLADFRRATELEEFLPNNFVLKQGIAPDSRMLGAALGLKTGAGKGTAERSTTLEQFHALTHLRPDGDTVRLYAFHERRWRD